MDRELERVSQRRLVLAKHLFRHASAQLEGHSPSSRLLAIHGLHNAVETTLRALVLGLEVRTDKTLNVTFEVMLSEVDGALRSRQPPQSLPYRTEMRNLNAARNLAIHCAHVPSTEALVEHHLFTRKFLERVAQDVFTLDFAGLHQASLIKCLGLVVIMECARECIDQERWAGAVGWSLVAFEFSSRSTARTLSVDPDPYSPLTFWHSDDPATAALGRVTQKLHKRIVAMADQIVAAAGGMDPVTFARLKSLPVHVFIAGGGNPSFQYSGDVVEEDAVRAYQTVEDAILQWQDVGLVPSVPDEQMKGLRNGLADFKNQYLVGESGQQALAADESPLAP